MDRRALIVAGCLAAGAAFAAPPKPTAQLLDQGKTAFTTNCAACHGDKGDGTGPAAVALTPKPRNFATEQFKQGTKPEEIFKTLQTGVPGSAMVPFTHLPEQDRWALTYYVLELKKPGSVLKKK